MRVAVLSGKGGTGKTFIAVNLAAISQNAAYIDCDVEEPNGRLFFKPQNVKSLTISRPLPDFDAQKCSGCRKCVDFCRFNALVFIKNTPMLFPEICHSCGGCALVCPSNAVTEKPRPIGAVECGSHGSTQVVTGVLNVGESSGIAVINAALAQCADDRRLAVIDCPPGSACPVMESVSGADYCILVAEPTAFGLHNFQMVYELVSLLNKPCGVVINKFENENCPIDDFCREHHIPVLCRVPYSEKLADIGAKANIACEHSADAASMFRALLAAVESEAKA